MSIQPYPVIPIQADPRIGTLRPGWLADDQTWRDQLQALDLDADIRWIEGHWSMAAGRGAAVDTSWITFETVGGTSPLIPLAVLVIGAVAIFGPLLLWVR